MKSLCPLLAVLLTSSIAAADPSPPPAVAPTAPAAPLPTALATPVAPPAASAPDDTVPHPLRLAVVPSSAFGLTHAKFFNQLIGVRIDYRFTSRFAFGGTLSYVNLKGKDRRVHNVLPEATTEYRLPLHQDKVGLPLHFSLGFLPQNGPTLRLGAGIDFALSDTVSLELTPLEPMLWITRERPEVSLDASLALRLAF